MKSKLLLSILMLGSLLTKAQITLEHSFTNKNGTGSVVLFSANGTKFMINDTSGNQVKLYNTDYSLWKTITLPTYAGYKFQYGYAVSDNLFNSDNSVELMAVYYNSSIGTYKSEIVSESGTVLQSTGNAYSGAIHYINGVYKLKAMTIVSGSPISYNYDFYSLPGTMPCGQCGSLGMNKEETTSDVNVSVIPNPNIGEFLINESGELIITNGVGETIYSDRNYKPGTINIKSQPAGIYYLKIGNKVTPFVKQ